MDHRSGAAGTRRAFVIDSALASLALATGLGCGGANQKRVESGTSRGSGAQPQRRLGVALLGLGEYASTQLGPALKKTQHCELRGIVTGSPDKVDTWKDDYDLADANVYSYETFARIKDNRSIDVVYIVTPTALHAQFARKAAEAGKHVWCEKPMAMNVRDCQSIIDACRANKVELSIGYRMHHEPNTQTVMRMAKDKPYGAITNIRAVAGDKNDADGTWRMKRAMGGGALYDMGVYAINAIRYASGEEPVRVVRARQWTDRPDDFTEVDENTEFELELPSGVIAYGKASRGENTNKLRVEAQRGWYELEPMQAYSGVEGKTSDGRALDTEIDNQQARQMDDDALAILEHRPMPVPGAEGQRDIRIIEAIMEAVKLGAAVKI